MPTVLITGLNGFVAVHTAVVFLSKGWHVRGTVRSLEKATKVQALPAFRHYEGKVEVLIVEDLVNGDLSTSLKGVDGIAHIASPFYFTGKSWSEYRDPAVGATVNVIEQAAKFPSIKSIAQMSSFAAIGDFSQDAYSQKGRLYDESDWLPTTEEEAQRAEGDMKIPTWYCASKKFAELAAIDTVKRTGNKQTLGRICPLIVLGPAIHFAKASGDDLAHADSSTSSIYQTLASGRDGMLPGSGYPLWADVRNVAQALYQVVSEKVNGRFALNNGVFDHQLLANRARELFPDLAKKGVIPVGDPDDTPSRNGTYELDGTKAERELGIKYITLDKMIKDTVEQMIEIGAIQV